MYYTLIAWLVLCTPSFAAFKLDSESITSSSTELSFTIEERFESLVDNLRPEAIKNLLSGFSDIRRVEKYSQTKSKEIINEYYIITSAYSKILPTGLFVAEKELKDNKLTYTFRGPLKTLKYYQQPLYKQSRPESLKDSFETTLVISEHTSDKKKSTLKWKLKIQNRDYLQYLSSLYKKRTIQYVIKEEDILKGFSTVSKPALEQFIQGELL